MRFAIPGTLVFGGMDRGGGGRKLSFSTLYIKFCNHM